MSPLHLASNLLADARGHCVCALGTTPFSYSTSTTNYPNDSERLSCQHPSDFRGVSGRIILYYKDGKTTLSLHSNHVYPSAALFERLPILRLPIPCLPESYTFCSWPGCSDRLWPLYRTSVALTVVRCTGANAEQELEGGQGARGVDLAWCASPRTYRPRLRSAHRHGLEDLRSYALNMLYSHPY